MARSGGQETFETRLRKQAAAMRRTGRTAEDHDDILDLYLAGESARDIGKAFSLKPNSVHRILSHQALFRLMKARAVERLNEIEDMMS